MTVPLHHVVAGDGPPVVLLHAFPLDHRMWSAQIDVLSAGYRVIAVDLRGFGATPLGDEAPDLDAMADDVAALLDELSVRGCTVVGLSMGGYVAMAMLRRRPDLLTAIALVDTKAGADGDAGRANRERIAQEVLSSGMLDVVLSDVVPGLTGATTAAERPGVLTEVRRLVAAARPDSIAWAQRAMAGRPDSFAQLAAFAGPVLVVVGDEDAIAPPAEAEAMTEAARRGRLVSIAGAGHLTAMEQPGVLSDALLRWLDEEVGA